MKETSEPTLHDITPLLKDYEPSPETVELVHTTPIALLVGVSGAGKGTIKEELLETGKYHHIISHTTRKPRSNNGVPEQDGVDYHFIDIEEAKKLLEAGEYVEAKIYSGNVYGTTTSDIGQAHKEGKIALTDIEVQGVAEYIEISPEVIAIFILPPNIETWRERILGRGTMEHSDLLKRLGTAPEELETALREPYYKFVINDSLEEAVSYARQVIEKNKVDPIKQQAGREVAQVLLKEAKELISA
jgi:guanylate kinase